MWLNAIELWRSHLVLKWFRWHWLCVFERLVPLFLCTFQRIENANAFKTKTKINWFDLNLISWAKSQPTVCALCCRQLILCCDVNTYVSRAYLLPCSVHRIVGTRDRSRNERHTESRFSAQIASVFRGRKIKCLHMVQTRKIEHNRSDIAYTRARDRCSVRCAQIKKKTKIEKYCDTHGVQCSRIECMGARTR